MRSGVVIGKNKVGNWNPSQKLHHVKLRLINVGHLSFPPLCCLENYITNSIYSLYVTITIIITLSVKYYVHVYNVNTAAQGP